MRLPCPSYNQSAQGRRLAKRSRAIAGGADLHTTNLRKVGGSIMLAVPPVVLEILNLRPGTKVGLAVEHGRLVVEPRPRPRYTLDELLAKCNAKAPRDKDEREWLEGKSAGCQLV